MRVISGTARHQRLLPPEGLDIRPTSDRVKEALFSMLQFSLAHAHFLDLFAGSGQIGIEALSRGADFALFVDQNRQAQAIVKQNLQTTGLYHKSKVVAMSATEFLTHTKERFDIIFLDPPYGEELLPSLLALIPKVLLPGGLVVCEHLASQQLPIVCGDLALCKQHRYGRIMLSRYQMEGAIAE